ncbi:hypothetical protein CL657_05575 [bacterium]|nr:hypothetical protein [bacterium]|tara:strand:- start:206 stop:727 length:522 start_codon:yes stop_codon:yes gene_type:complete
MLNDHKINRISLFSSIIIHIALVIVSFLSFKKPIVITSSIQPVPIEFSIKEIVIAKPNPKEIIQTPAPKSAKPTKKLPVKHKDDRSKPVLESHKEPYYPKEAINFSFEGTVVVNVVVNTQGRVSDVTVVKSSGHSILDKAFISTIKSTYIFKPKRVEGVNVVDTITLSHTFSL